MRHKKKPKQLSKKRRANHAMLKNLAVSLILYEKIKTTQARAKLARSYVERLITMAKKGNLANVRRLYSSILKKGAVRKLIEEFAPRYKDRAGGYTRIVKLGKTRKGDGAELVEINFT